MDNEHVEYNILSRANHHSMELTIFNINEVAVVLWRAFFVCYCLFALNHEIWIYVFEIQKGKHIKSDISDILPSC